MRGKVGNRPGGQLPVGITPACAGKSSGHMQRFGTSGDHPRVCGEKAVLLMCSCHSRGSPPHVRGKGRLAGAVSGCNGITPACAGKSNAFTASTVMQRDHPRMCGEKSTTSPRWTMAKGSPPHVRGKGTSRELKRFSSGITPACAGKRVIHDRKDGRAQDHPRMCGEKKKQTKKRGML